MTFESSTIRHLVFKVPAFLCVLMHSGTLPLQADEKDDVKGMLAGKWLAVAEESNGSRMKKADVQKMKKTLEIDGDTFVLSWLDKSIKGTIDLKLDERPTAIDLSGNLAGRDIVLRGIIEVNARLSHFVNQN